MRTKNKLRLIITAAILCVAAVIYVFNATVEWNKYSTPITEKNVVIETYRAEDYPVDGKMAYYYQVKAEVKYTQAMWPKIEMQLLKSDTLLLLHNCSVD